MADKIYMMGVLIYFMCPTGFAMPMLISPLYKGEEDEESCNNKHIKDNSNSYKF